MADLESGAFIELHIMQLVNSYTEDFDTSQSCPQSPQPPQVQHDQNLISSQAAQVETGPSTPTARGLAKLLETVARGQPQAFQQSGDVHQATGATASQGPDTGVLHDSPALHSEGLHKQQVPFAIGSPRTGAVASSSNLHDHSDRSDEHQGLQMQDAHHTDPAGDTDPAMSQPVCEAPQTSPKQGQWDKPVCTSSARSSTQRHQYAPSGRRTSRLAMLGQPQPLAAQLETLGPSLATWLNTTWHLLISFTTFFQCVSRRPCLLLRRT